MPAIQVYFSESEYRELLKVAGEEKITDFVKRVAVERATGKLVV